MPLGFKKKLEILILYFLLQVGKPSGETACTASNRYLLIGPGALWREGVMDPCTHGYQAVDA